MHSIATRLNAVLSVTFMAVTTCAVAMGVLSYLRHEFLWPATPTGNITIVETRVDDVMMAHPQMHTATMQVERAIVLFDLDADFTDCFDWNTKQVFVYVVAEYAAPGFPENHVTLYDHILTSASDAKLSLRRAADYPLIHIAQRGLAGNTNMTIRLKYHIMCHSGVTHTKDVPAATLTLSMPTRKNSR